MLSEVAKILTAVIASHNYVEHDYSLDDLSKLALAARAYAEQTSNTSDEMLRSVHSGELEECLDELVTHLGRAVVRHRKILSELSKSSEDAEVRLNNLAKVAGEIHPLSSADVRKQVWNLTNGLCTYCGIQLTNDGQGGATAFCIEHVIPVSKGGPDHLTNYVPSCLGCNSAKSDRHVLHFIRNVLPSRIQAASNVVQMQPAPMPELVVVAAGEKP